MKKSIIFLLFFVTIIVIISCKKDEDSISFVNDYDAPLTEDKGIEYSGNYFPIDINNYWYWEGSESVSGKITMTYQGETTTESLDDDISGYSTVLIKAPTSINLGSGTYTLFPAQETANTDQGISTTIRYYEKTNDNIYIRAIKTDYGDIIEVENPTYLKIPIVVGDKWETQPQVNLEKLIDEQSVLSSGNIDMAMSCVIYVIGKENINWKGNNFETIRLDERAEAKATINVEEDGITGSMSFTIQMTFYLNLLKDVGIIRQRSDLTITMNGSFSGEGEKISIKMNMDSDGNYTLSTYNISKSGKISINNSITEKSGLKSSLLEKIDNHFVQKQIKTGLRLAEIMKKLKL